MTKHICIFLLAVTLTGSAVKAQVADWTSNPFEHRAFVKNNGQFNFSLTGGSLKPLNTQILYGASANGVELYFTTNGITYKHNELIPATEEEKEELEKGRSSYFKNEKEERSINKSVPRFLSIEWLGSNPNSEIIAMEPVSFYYTYGNIGNDGASTIKAPACRKIIYKNIYQNIDVEYILPEKGGVKYSIILHPGADLSQVMMRYQNAIGLMSDIEGNIIIQSEFGDFVDHAPISFYENGTKIGSSFKINGDSVSFILNKHNNSPKIIIDPWTSSPTFPNNRAFDINYDLAGNVYVYGSSPPYKLAKFNSTGVLQWQYSTWSNFNTVLNQFEGMYGDFSVDEVSGTSYIVEGYGQASVLKINTMGLQTGMYPGGNRDMNEMWRCEYNRCINKIVIAGGGTFGINQAAMLDTTMATITPVNVLNTTNSYHDFGLLCIDPSSSFCYMGTNRTTAPWSTNLDNVLLKLQVPNLGLPVWSVNSNHTFVETQSLTFYPTYNTVLGPMGYPNGFNGMAASPGFLYTYDGSLLKKWNKSNGNFLGQVNTGGTMFASGGLTTDGCDNVYAGTGNVIKVYNSSLVQIGTYPVPNTVYDIKLGLNNKLYACGVGFVTEILVSNSIGNVTVSSAPQSGCSCNGTATATISCGSGNLSGYNYLWAPGGQTTQTAVGLCPGTYTVNLTTNCSNTISSTVTISGNTGGLSIVSNVINNVYCNNGNNGKANAIAAGGLPGYTYLWNNGQNTQTATGLSAGSYTVTVTDNSGCTNKSVVIISQSSSVVIIAKTFNWRVCEDSVNYSWVAMNTVLGGTAPYTYNWSNGQTGSPVKVFNSGIYTVTATDAFGCSGTTTVMATLPTKFTYTLSTSSVPAHCGKNNGQASITANSVALTYIWLPGGQTTTAVKSTLTGLSSGIYTVSTSYAGCPKTFTISVTGYSGLPLITTAYAACVAG
ncbi:MAG: hypothetical protein HYU69_02705, partial [Bacteroidetes bacterium]|nr:hypothetical protein [Bacteroidota bacterium]